MDYVEPLLRRALLATTLLLTCLLGFLTSYVLVLLALAAAVLLGIRGQLHANLASRWFLVCFLAVTAIIVINTREPRDLLHAINLIALLYSAPLTSLYQRAASPTNTETVANLALAGTIVGLGYAIFDAAMLGHPRAGSLTTDPIRLADTALILGFLSLMGLLGRTDRLRWIYLPGPVLALATIYLSGSRGPLLAYTPMLIVAAFLLIQRKRTAAVIGAACLAVFGAALGVATLLGNRSASLIEVLTMVSRGAAADEATRIRMALYRAGWDAFLQSPIFGHGWTRVMSSAMEFLPDADRIQAQLPHLHNEALNFAVFGGIVGLAIYVTLLAIPIWACLRTPRDSQYRARFYGCALLTVSYFLLGLPDTMLSFELHIALYVAITAILLGYCRDAPPTGSRATARELSTGA